MITVTKEAVQAMQDRLTAGGLAIAYADGSSNRPSSAELQMALGEALLAGAEHLTDTGQPLAPLAAARRDYDAELTRMYQLGRRDAEDAANRRMIQVVETEARTLSESVIGPTDYELWFDSLRLGLDLAAHRNQPLVSDEQVLEAAGWFWHQLQDPPQRAEYEDSDPPEHCAECGLAEGHDEECPHRTVTYPASE